MTRDEAVALMKQRMGNNNDTSLDALIVTEMQFVQSTLLEQAPELPWFLYGSQDVVESTEEITAPTGYLREFAGTPLQVYNGNKFVKFSKGDQVSLDAYDFNTTYAYPVAYANEELNVNEVNLRVFGWDGSSNYTVRWNGYYADTALSTNVENKWLKFAPDLLIAETGVIISSQYNSFMQFAQIFADQKNKALARLQARNAVWEEDVIDRRMGG